MNILSVFNLKKAIGLGLICCFPFHVLFSKDYLITELGAVGDGKTDNTRVIQDVINECSETGGRVVFPGGEFLTGSVEIKSNVKIHLESTARWSAIPDTTKFVNVPFSSRKVFIYTNGAANISLTGKGTINGNGDMHDVFIPAPGHLRKGSRPYGLLFWRSENITVLDVTLINSAFWMFRIDECDDVQIDRLKINNHSNFNNDGLDITDCHRVTVSNCILDCEDDALCFKSESSRGVKDITVTNCIISSHASAIKWGTASYGNFERIAISNCVIKPSLTKHTLHPAQLVGGLAGIDISHTDGGTIKDVSFDNIIIDSVQTAIFVRLGNRNRIYNKASKDRSRDENKTGVINGIHFSNITARNIGEVCASISACPGTFVENVSITDFDISFKVPGNIEDVGQDVPEYSGRYPYSRMYTVNLPAYGLYLRHVKDVQLDDLVFRPAEGEPRPEIVMDDAVGVYLGQIRTTHPGRDEPVINK